MVFSCVILPVKYVIKSPYSSRLMVQFMFFSLGGHLSSMKVNQDEIWDMCRWGEKNLYNEIY